MTIAQSQANVGIKAPNTKEQINTNTTVMIVSSQFLDVSIFAMMNPAIHAKIRIIQNFRVNLFIEKRLIVKQCSQLSHAGELLPYVLT